MRTGSPVERSATALSCDGLRMCNVDLAAVNSPQSPPRQPGRFWELLPPWGRPRNNSRPILRPGSRRREPGESARHSAAPLPPGACVTRHPVSTTLNSRSFRAQLPRRWRHCGRSPYGRAQVDRSIPIAANQTIAHLTFRQRKSYHIGGKKRSFCQFCQHRE